MTPCGNTGKAENSGVQKNTNARGKKKRSLKVFSNVLSTLVAIVLWTPHLQTRRSIGDTGSYTDRVDGCKAASKPVPVALSFWPGCSSGFSPWLHKKGVYGQRRIRVVTSSPRSLAFDVLLKYWYCNINDVIIHISTRTHLKDWQITEWHLVSACAGQLQY
jgi:hypothetical protein